jgi:two-component system nitrogen regulation sensor histidine kinase NtrY
LPKPRITHFDLLKTLTHIQAQHTCYVVCEALVFDVQLDQAQFEQVFINLIKNAREACGASCTVKIHVNRRTDRINLVVADDGPGVSAQVLQKALMPFYSTKQHGTGLVLPLCREIVEARGGQLSIRNGTQTGLEILMQTPQV